MTHIRTSTQNARRLAELRAGSEQAFEAVYREQRTVVYSFLVRLTGDPHVAEDLFQNVWLKLARHAAWLRPDTDLKAWLLTVARHEHIDYRRAQVLDLSRLLVLGRQSQCAPWADHEPCSRRDLEVALERLQDADREVLLLEADRDLTPADAARVLGLSPTAWRKRLSRARQRLAQHLEVTSQHRLAGEQRRLLSSKRGRA